MGQGASDEKGIYKQVPSSPTGFDTDEEHLGAQLNRDQRPSWASTPDEAVPIWWERVESDLRRRSEEYSDVAVGGYWKMLRKEIRALYDKECWIGKEEDIDHAMFVTTTLSDRGCFRWLKVCLSLGFLLFFEVPPIKQLLVLTTRQRVILVEKRPIISLGLHIDSAAIVRYFGVLALLTSIPVGLLLAISDKWSRKFLVFGVVSVEEEAEQLGDHDILSKLHDKVKDSLMFCIFSLLACWVVFFTWVVRNRQRTDCGTRSFREFHAQAVCSAQCALENGSRILWCSRRRKIGKIRFFFGTYPEREKMDEGLPPMCPAASVVVPLTSVAEGSSPMTLLAKPSAQLPVPQQPTYQGEGEQPRLVSTQCVSIFLVFCASLTQIFMLYSVAVEGLNLVKAGRICSDATKGQDMEQCSRMTCELRAIESMVSSYKFCQAIAWLHNDTSAQENAYCMSHGHQMPCCAFCVEAEMFWWLGGEDPNAWIQSAIAVLNFLVLVLSLAVTGRARMEPKAMTTTNGFELEFVEDFRNCEPKHFQINEELAIGFLDRLYRSAQPRFREVSTSLIQPAIAGSAEIEVASHDGLSIGDEVSIGDDDEDKRVIVGFGPLHLDHQLAHEHNRRAVVNHVSSGSANAGSALRRSAKARQSHIEVARPAKFSVGDVISISEGGNPEETRVVTSRPMQLDKPLSHAFKAGDVVRLVKARQEMWVVAWWHAEGRADGIAFKDQQKAKVYLRQEDRRRRSARLYDSQCAVIDECDYSEKANWELLDKWAHEKLMEDDDYDDEFVRQNDMPSQPTQTAINEWARSFCPSTGKISLDGGSCSSFEQLRWLGLINPNKLHCERPAGERVVHAWREPPPLTNKTVVGCMIVAACFLVPIIFWPDEHGGSPVYISACHDTGHREDLIHTGQILWLKFKCVAYRLMLMGAFTLLATPLILAFWYWILLKTMSSTVIITDERIFAVYESLPLVHLVGRCCGCEHAFGVRMDVFRHAQGIFYGRMNTKAPSWKDWLFHKYDQGHETHQPADLIWQSIYGVFKIDRRKGDPEKLYDIMQRSLVKDVPDLDVPSGEACFDAILKRQQEDGADPYKEHKEVHFERTGDDIPEDAGLKEGRFQLHGKEDILFLWSFREKGKINTPFDMYNDIMVTTDRVRLQKQVYWKNFDCRSCCCWAVCWCVCVQRFLQRRLRVSHLPKSRSFLNLNRLEAFSTDRSGRPAGVWLELPLFTSCCKLCTGLVTGSSCGSLDASWGDCLPKERPLKNQMWLLFLQKYSKTVLPDMVASVRPYAPTKASNDDDETFDEDTQAVSELRTLMRDILLQREKLEK